MRAELARDVTVRPVKVGLRAFERSEEATHAPSHSRLQPGLILLGFVPLPFLLVLSGLVLQHLKVLRTKALQPSLTQFRAELAAINTIHVDPRLVIVVQDPVLKTLEPPSTQALGEALRTGQKQTPPGSRATSPDTALHTISQQRLM